MPAPYPDEFKQRAMQMVRDGTPVVHAAKQLGIAESGLRRWLDQDEINGGRKPGLTTDERKELAELRRAKRRLEMENEILKRAAAYFAQENVLPKMMFPVVDRLTAEGFPVSLTCRLVGCRPPGSTTGSPGRRRLGPWPTPSSSARSGPLTSCPAAPTGRPGCTPNCGWAWGSAVAESESSG